jgi:hypothetical protein
MILCSLYNIISGVRVFASSAVDRRLESRSSKAKDYGGGGGGGGGEGGGGWSALY